MFFNTKLRAQLRKLEIEHGSLQLVHAQLLRQWNELVRQINAKGGMEFLNGQQPKPQLTRDELAKLIALCHPDKHGGKQMANEMTQRLLELRRIAS